MKAHTLLMPKVQIEIRISHILNRLADMAQYAFSPLNEIIVFSHFPYLYTWNLTGDRTQDLGV